MYVVLFRWPTNPFRIQGFVPLHAPKLISISFESSEIGDNVPVCPVVMASEDSKKALCVNQGLHERTRLVRVLGIDFL